MAIAAPRDVGVRELCLYKCRRLNPSCQGVPKRFGVVVKTAGQFLRCIGMRAPLMTCSGPFLTTGKLTFACIAMLKQLRQLPVLAFL